MQQYGVREVERLLGLSRSAIHALTRAGLVSPARGARNAWLFSFQDLVVLRTARALLAARVPQRRLVKALRELRRRSESGQYPLAFGEEPAPRRPGAAEREVSAALNVNQWLEKGVALHERGDLALAECTYRNALAQLRDDPTLQYNLGVLLEDMGRKAEALEAYRAALRGDPELADAHYNLALLCAKLGRRHDAIRHLTQYRKLTRKR